MPSNYTSENNQNYLDQLTNFVNMIPKGNLIIICADINTSIGTCIHSSDEKDYTVNLNVINPHGDKK